MPPKRRRRFQGLYYHSSPPKVLPMNDQLPNQNGRRRRDVDEFAIKLSTIRIWMHEKDIGKLTRILWAGQGNRLRQQASTNPRVKRFLAAVPYVMNAIKDVHQAVIDNNLETLQSKLEPPVPAALVTGKDANGLNVIHKAAGLGHTKILEYLISIWPEGANEADITGKTPLHWAASAKNNMRCYTILTQAGCDEECVDYKSKTPSYYRHKPHEIERAFLVYLPDAPRVSPDIVTDWDALCEDTNSDKKSDIKIPLTNGIKERTNDSTNDENFSEAELNDGVSANDENDIPKDDDDNENENVDDNFDGNDIENGNKTAPGTPTAEENQEEINKDEEEENNELNGNNEKGEENECGNSAVDGDIPAPNLAEESIGKEKAAELVEHENNEVVNENEAEDLQKTEEEVEDEEEEQGEGIGDEKTEQEEDLESGEDHEMIDEKEQVANSKQENPNENNEDNNESENENLNESNNSDEQKLADEENIEEEDNELEKNQEEEYENDEIGKNHEENENKEIEENEENEDENESQANNENIEETEKTETESENENENETDEAVVNEVACNKAFENSIENENMRNVIENDLPKHLLNEYKKKKANKIIKQDQETGEKTCIPKPAEDTVAVEEQKQVDQKEVNNNNDYKTADNSDKVIEAKTETESSSDENVEEDDDEDVIVPGNEGNDNINTAPSEQEAEIELEPEPDEPDEGERDEIDEDAQSNDKLDENHNNGSLTSSLAIEGFVEGVSEDNTVQSQSDALIDEESHIQKVIASGDMEQLAQIVLNGDGSKLLDMQSPETDIQAFLNNVPNYMSKIRRVHEAAREGSLLSLQQALDRRKFAIAKDEISPNGATPLHVAVLFGHSDIVRYLAARFPETTTITDNDGRTALHYASVIKDNGHFYNMLTQLGANPKTKDKLGHTPEFYFDTENSSEVLTYRELLSNFGAEDLEAELLSDQGEAESHSFQSNPIFKTEQGKYLANTLAEPLIEALTEIANKRPDDPISYLAGYLQSYMRSRSSKIGAPSSSSTAVANSNNTRRMNGNLRNAAVTNNDDIDVDESEEQTTPQIEDRDEHGQSMLHFACARSHRRGGLMHLIEESNIDITYRDELYRTARDVSLQANQLANAREIDHFVLSLAVVGDLKPFEHFATVGYDHITDITDNNENSIIDIVAERNHEELADFLRNLRTLEELREELHQMIRDNNVERIKEIVSSSDGKWLLNAKNYYGRTALHIAVLKESEEIVEYFIEQHPEIIKIGDNLERTPLHYAMGTNAVEGLSRLLINKGAKRTTKDLKGRQPSYYFMNKADVLRLQEEEDENR